MNGGTYVSPGVDDTAEAALIAILMFVATAVWSWATLRFTGQWPGLLEFFGTMTGLTCVWLTRTQNVMCWPVGIVSCAALGVFFWQVDLPGQAALNLVFFVGSSVWGWWQWRVGVKGHRLYLDSDGTVAAAEGVYDLPVTGLKTYELFGIAGAVLGATFLSTPFIHYINPMSVMPFLDALVVWSSVAAQLLLGRKKVEAWWLWLGPVNLCSIYLFVVAGAYTVAALYVAFFFHAAWALRTWASVEQAPPASGERGPGTTPPFDVPIPKEEDYE